MLTLFFVIIFGIQESTISFYPGFMLLGYFFVTIFFSFYEPKMFFCHIIPENVPNTLTPFVEVCTKDYAYSFSTVFVWLGILSNYTSFPSLMYDNI